MLDWQVLTDPADLEALAPEWDQLAVQNGLPMMAPACVLGWRRHLAPALAEFRAIAVFDGSQLAGLAPFYLDGGRRALGMRLPGIELAGGLAPLVAPGRAGEVGGAFAAALARSPLCRGPVSLEGNPRSLDWADTLAQGWPGRLRPASRRYQVQGCPKATLDATSFEQWLTSKSANFRGSMRRMRRHFLAAGGRSRTSTRDTLRQDVEAFVRLHTERWQGKGGSSFVRLGSALADLLVEIGRAQLDQEGRFRMRVLEIDGEPITAQLFLAAGERVHYVNGGWDARFGGLKPPMLALLDTVEEAFSRGETVLDLGLGQQTYKLRFADSVDDVVWDMLIPADVHMPLALLRTAPIRSAAILRSAVKSRLPEPQLTRLRRLRERVHGFEGPSRAPARRIGAEPRRSRQRPAGISAPRRA
jgi:CelD/BcsL family acetyltransferase involved in cellulose biosynthesis